jgi:serine/threonine-protein kinase
MSATPPSESPSRTAAHTPASEASTRPGANDASPLAFSAADAGRYEFHGEIGRGGVGAILHAHDRSLKRDLALKVLLEKHLDQPDTIRRFVEEAQIGGQLQHPGLVPVYERGTFADGRPYFTMKLVKGQTLAALLSERPDPAHDLPRFLKVFEQVCQTLAYAHAKGVIHRDLKPSNVMVGAFGGVQVMDWGLAKVLTEARSTQRATEPSPPVSVIETVRSGDAESGTNTGAVMGTYAYMPPEQARGEAERLDRRCDVFGLGAVLCQILTGEAPYVGPPEEVRVQARLGFLTSAHERLDGCGADAELVRLAKSCLQPRPEDRLADAGVVAEALTAYLAGVQQRLHQAELERTAAEARAAAETKARQAERRARHRTLALAGTVIGVLLLGGVGWWWLEQDRAARREETTTGVNQALGKVEQLRQDATKRSLDELAGAEAALALGQQALAAVEQAQGVLRTGLANEELQRRVDGLDGEVKAALALSESAVVQRRKEIKLLAALDHARGLTALTEEGQWVDRTAAQAYAAALAEYSGLEVRTASAQALADWLQRCPAALREPLLAALELWAGCAEHQQNEQGLKDGQRLREVLDRADPDPWRRSYRAAVKEPGTQRLRQLAEQARGKPLPPGAFLRLGSTLFNRQEKALAVELLRGAQASYPDDFWLNFELGYFLYGLKAQQPALLEEAIGFYRAALALRPGSAPVHNNLGNALRARKDLAGAIACYRKAVALDPNLAFAYANLGETLHASKDLAGAIAAYRRAIALDPSNAKVYNNLGAVLHASKDLDGAIAAFRKALEIDPSQVKVRINLGNVLRARKDLAGAITSYQKALTLDRNNAKAWHNLGGVLRETGEIAKSLAAFRSFQKIVAGTPATKELADQQIRYTEQFLELVRKLPAFLKGQDQPADARQGLLLSRLCYWKQLHTAAARFARDAFAAQPPFADDLSNEARYTGACSAALAGCGRGKDAPREDKERAGLRREALTWLQADLALWSRRLAGAKAADRLKVQQALAQWCSDLDLAGVRDAAALAKLPEAERQAWQTFWGDVEKLQKQADMTAP